MGGWEGKKQRIPMPANEPKTHRHTHQVRMMQVHRPMHMCPSPPSIYMHTYLRMNQRPLSERKKTGRSTLPQKQTDRNATHDPHAASQPPNASSLTPETPFLPEKPSCRQTHFISRLRHAATRCTCSKRRDTMHSRGSALAAAACASWQSTEEAGRRSRWVGRGCRKTESDARCDG